MNREQFGLVLDDVLRDLPPAAGPFLRNVAFVLERRPEHGPAREADWIPSPLHSYDHLSQYWRLYPPSTHAAPLGRISLYMEPIAAAGPDTAAELRRVILRAIERKEGLGEGALEGGEPEEVPGWTPEQEEDGEGGAVEAESDAEGLVEIAECEIGALPSEARDWFDGVEIVEMEEPEAEGDPGRLADFPEPGDEPRVLVLYAGNIRRDPESAATVVRLILRQALARRARSA